MLLVVLKLLPNYCYTATFEILVLLNFLLSGLVIVQRDSL